MKPDVPATLANFAGKLRKEFVPQLAGFSAGNAGMIAAMLDMIGEQWDHAADLLLRENAVLREIVSRGMGLFPAACTSLPPAAKDVRISSLEAENEALREQLTTIHATAELATGPDAARLDADIWAALRDGVKARRISSANF